MSLSIEAVRAFDPEQKIHSFDEMPGLITALGRAGIQVILAQGAFDIVHLGHVGYIRAAGQIDPRSSVVAIGVDSDEAVQANKGPARPINPVQDRVRFLAEFVSAGLVFAYEDVPDYNDPDSYDVRFGVLRAVTLAVPPWDPHLHLKQQQADRVGMQVAYVDAPLIQQSSTRILELLEAKY
ncbi:MAG TPA: adenylyltransferase/cytidyltransferase family protein [Candidatus Saccharimonadales bacterium]|nr:adenylyltransferase/cytidyltransferase family protein [Candidatus Saccharimonadales bacterium]